MLAVFADSELIAIRDTKAELIKRGIDQGRIGIRTLALCTMNSKCRVVSDVVENFNALGNISKCIFC
jgi:hypothetical protein